VHIDQTTPGFISVQGGLAVTSQAENEHVFLCIPGSHVHHEELLTIWEKANPGKKPELHWEIMIPEQLTFLRSKGLEMRRVPMNAGDFVLWDSRTVHSSAPYCADAPLSAMRLQIFVCMRPVTELSEKERKVRREAYESGRVSKHSADQIRLFGKQPRMYSQEDKATHEKMKVPPSVELSEEEKLVYGL
jgi:hypothetical protein